MNIDFITDPEMAPRPREEVKIIVFKVTPYPDGYRFRLDIQTTPFAPADQPCLEIEALDEDKNRLGSVSIIDSIHHTLSLTMHGKEPDMQPGTYSFIAQLYYDPLHIQHKVTAQVRLPDDIPAAR